MQNVFQKIYDNNDWLSDQSVSGNGSTLEATAEIRKKLPTLFTQLGIKSVLDIPCGDYNWWKEMKVELDEYRGADIVPELIKRNQQYEAYNKAFEYLDASKDDLPKVDLILCRDLLGHFSNVDVQRTLKNFRNSGSKYLLSTTFPDHENVTNITTGEWRPINLASLWGLPTPLQYINEKCAIPGFEDKSLGLWRIN